MATRPIPTPPKVGKQRLIIGILLAVVVLGGLASFLFSGKSAPRSVARRAEIITITLPPPPVIPPPKVEPPPPTVPPPEDQMVAQEPVPDDEPPPDAAPPEAPSSDVLGTGIAGNGPDMGLGRGTGTGNRIGGSGRKGGGSKFGWYAAKVQTTIADALRGNPATRNASFSMQVRIWADSGGRITDAKLVGSTGNSAVDDAIRNRILIGLSLPQAPPSDMPMPITMRLTARKSGT